MKRFKQFLEESVAATKRQNMIHLEKMKPVDFVDLAHEIATKYKGVLKDVKMSLKVDGAGIRFGKDANGKFFMETSRSGPIQTRGAFSAYAAQNPRADSVRAAHYDDMYDHLEKSDLWKILPNDTKVVAEVMYNPMAEVIGDKIKFVTVKYDKSKLGELMTIFPFTVLVASTGEPHPEAQKIIEDLKKKSNKRILIGSVDLSSKTYNVDALIKPVLMLGKPEDVKRIITSRKKVDAEKKKMYMETLDNVKQQIAQLILQNRPGDSNRYGDEIEGLVLQFGDKTYKVTTPDFRASKSKK